MRAEIERLVGTPYVEDGVERPLRYDDFIVVAPYNAHVRCLREQLPEAVRVGTVDKFQGQQATVSFFAMASSIGRGRPARPRVPLLAQPAERGGLAGEVPRLRGREPAAAGDELQDGGADAARERALPLRGGGRGAGARRPARRVLLSGGEEDACPARHEIRMSTRSPITWSAPVGRYSFEVSVYSGSYAQFASASSKTDKAQARKNATALRTALAEEDAGRQPATLVEAVEKLEHSADAVTDRVEHADKLFKAVAEGRLLDPRLLTDEIGSLLGLLDRLDREKRYEEEIRVAKALHGLCVLAFRWIDLVRSLRRALAAADAIGDEAGQAWALNELGALHLCAGDAKRASEHLGRASELYEKLGDAAGRCATRHNFDSARRDVARPVQLRAPRHLLTASGSIRPLVAGVVGATMLAVLGLAFAPFGPVAKKDDKGAGELVATIGARPSNPSASADAAFSFSAEGARGFECKLDDRALRAL